MKLISKVALVTVMMLTLGGCAEDEILTSSVGNNGYYGSGTPAVPANGYYSSQTAAPANTYYGSKPARHVRPAHSYNRSGVPAVPAPSGYTASNGYSSSQAPQVPAQAQGGYTTSQVPAQGGYTTSQ